MKSGDYALRWDGAEGAAFRLVEQSSDGERVIYEGTDTATTVTGRYAGDYRYRVEQVDAADAVVVSEPCLVMVRPYPLGVALAFFGFGLVVTLATVALVIFGHRAHRRGEIG